MSRRIKALEAKLDGRKVLAARLCVEREFAAQEDRKTTEEIAQEVGVTRQGLWKWRTQDPDFIEYMNLLADTYLSSYRSFVYKQLLKTISGEQPSVKGIDLFFRRHGLITEKHEVKTDTTASRDSEDLAKDIADLDTLLESDGDDTDGDVSPEMNEVDD